MIPTYFHHSVADSANIAESKTLADSVSLHAYYNFFIQGYSWMVRCFVQLDKGSRGGESKMAQAFFSASSNKLTLKYSWKTSALERILKRTILWDPRMEGVMRVEILGTSSCMLGCFPVIALMQCLSLLSIGSRFFRGRLTVFHSQWSYLVLGLLYIFC